MTNFFTLTGKSAVVTGGTSGIGLATAKRLKAAGADVAIAGRRPADDVAESFGATAFACDVSDEDQVAALMQGVVAAFGRLDIVVNCAGVNAGYNELINSEKQDFDFNYNVNTMGVVYGIKHGASRMGDGGAIVNVSSVAGLRASPESLAYCSSKAALIMLTQCIALDHGPSGVRANCVCPGWTRTPMADGEMEELAALIGGDRESSYNEVTRHVPLRRPASAEEVAESIVWLLSDRAAAVNGAVLTVDGGAATVDVATIAFNGNG